MRNFTILAIILLASACISETEYGKCVGITEDKKPALVYSVSGWNLFWDVMFSETYVVPIIGIFTEFQCPVARKDRI